MARDSKGKRSGQGVRQPVNAALLLTLVLFFLPALVVRGEPVYQRTDVVELPNGESVLPLDPTPSASPAGSRDKGRVVRLQTREGEITELTMAEYLWGVVAAEMPASFEEEALKAQACAARTYTAILQDRKSVV